MNGGASPTPEQIAETDPNSARAAAAAPEASAWLQNPTARTSTGTSILREILDRYENATGEEAADADEDTEA